MKRRPLGKTDIQITPIIFGGWQSGKDGWVGIDDSETIAAHKAAYEAGITTFDTAEWYGSGHSEQILASALSNVRDNVQILTKVAPIHLKHDEVIEACDRSLKNLKTDRIDLYQIHWPNDSVPIEETMSALNSMKDAGKIRAIGVSNFTAMQIADAEKFGRIESVQPPYSLFWRQIETDVVPYAVEHSLSVIAYSPLAQGLLTGKFGRDHVFQPGDVRLKNKLFSGENFDRALDAVDELKPIADKYGVSLGELSLAWLIAQPQTSAIVGARTAEQAVQNAKAADVELTEDDLATIDKIGRKVTDHLDSNPVMWNW